MAGFDRSMFITQGLYNFEANQVDQCLYQQDNLVMEEQTNPNMYQPLDFFSNQHDSPGHSQLLQVDLVHTQLFILF